MKTHFTIFICLLCFVIGYILGYSDKETKNNYNLINTIDTTYNTIELDSITYKIIIKDSVIYHLKIQSNEAIEKSYSINDSNAVVLFKQLTSE